MVCLPSTPFAPFAPSDDTGQSFRTQKMELDASAMAFESSELQLEFSWHAPPLTVRAFPRLPERIALLDALPFEVFEEVIMRHMLEKDALPWTLRLRQTCTELRHRMEKARHQVEATRLAWLPRYSSGCTFSDAALGAPFAILNSGCTLEQQLDHECVPRARPARVRTDPRAPPSLPASPSGMRGAIAPGSLSAGDKCRRPPRSPDARAAARRAGWSAGPPLPKSGRTAWTVRVDQSAGFAGWFRLGLYLPCANEVPDFAATKPAPLPALLRLRLGSQTQACAPPPVLLRLLRSLLSIYLPPLSLSPFDGRRASPACPALPCLPLPALRLVGERRRRPFMVDARGGGRGEPRGRVRRLGPAVHGPRRGGRPHTDGGRGALLCAARRLPARALRPRRMRRCGRHLVSAAPASLPFPSTAGTRTSCTAPTLSARARCTAQPPRPAGLTPLAAHPFCHPHCLGSHTATKRAPSRRFVGLKLTCIYDADAGELSFRYGEGAPTRPLAGFPKGVALCPWAYLSDCDEFTRRGDKVTFSPPFYTAA